MLKLRTLVLSAAIFAPMHLAAQDEHLGKGTSEVTGFGGIADSQGTFGGAYGRAITDRIFVFGEGSYITGDSTNVAGFSASGSAMNFHGGVHYSFRNRSKLVPYGAAGLGITRMSASASGGGLSISGSNSSLLFNFGGGARYYVGRNWGIRPELMVFAGDGSYVRAGAGLFFQF